MSQSNWSVDAYGVREQELAGIDSNAVIKKFKTLHPDEEIEDKNEADECISDYYGDAIGVYSMNGVIMEMLGKELHLDISLITWADNESGDELIGISPYYTWNIPNEIAALGTGEEAKRKIADAFVKVFAELGAELNPSAVDYCEIECWG
jgi:hypothetical protein